MPRGLHIIILLFDLDFLLFFSRFAADVGGHALLRLSRRLFRYEDNDDGTQLLLAIFTLGTNNDDGEDSRAHTASKLTDC